MTDTTSSPAAHYGVHSEVGQLRKVLVCAPGLAHERLTPTNCDDLLFALLAYEGWHILTYLKPPWR